MCSHTDGWLWLCYEICLKGWINLCAYVCEIERERKGEILA